MASIVGSAGNPLLRRASYRRPFDKETSNSNDPFLSHEIEGKFSPSIHDEHEKEKHSPHNDNDKDGTDDDDGDDAQSKDSEMSLYSALVTPKSIWDDISTVIRHSGWFILLSTAVGAMASFVVLVQITSNEQSKGPAETTYLMERRIPPDDEQQFLHDARMRGATKMHMGERDVILQGTTTPGNEGHLRLPLQFYLGVHLGLSAWDQWGEKLPDEQNAERNAALRSILEELDPRPTAVYDTVFEGGVEGFTVAYLAGTVSRQTGRDVHGRTDPIWVEAESAVMRVARDFQQLTITKWHASVWGPPHEADEVRHMTILQEIKPTRTGLRRLASTVPVYRVTRAQSFNHIISAADAAGGSTAGKDDRHITDADDSHP